MRSTSHSVFCVPMVICVAVCLLANCANVGSGGYSTSDSYHKMHVDVSYLKLQVQELESRVGVMEVTLRSLDSNSLAVSSRLTDHEVALKRLSEIDDNLDVRLELLELRSKNQP